jgi:hypothetical protein
MSATLQRCSGNSTTLVLKALHFGLQTCYSGLQTGQLGFQTLHLGLQPCNPVPQACNPGSQILYFLNAALKPWFSNLQPLGLNACIFWSATL